jgi:uncharacterized protein (TIGR02271 family)
MDRTVVAAFDSQHDAERALEALVDAGFSRTSARITSNTSGSDHTSGVASTHGREETLGDKIASFFGFGDDEEIYSEAVRRGSCVLTVDAADDAEAERAQDVLHRFGPVDLDERTQEWRGSGWQSSRLAGTTTADDDAIGATYRSDALGTRLENDTTGTTHPTGTTGTTHLTDTLGTTGTRDERADTVIPVTEERIEVGKREVQRGGVRVITRTVERPVEATVSLREEHATVTRRPVDRAVTDADQAFRDQTIEVRESAEEAVVGKTARVVEEVEVGKRAEVHEETIHDTVRKTDVEVEQLGSQTRSDYTSGREDRLVGGEDIVSTGTRSTGTWTGHERRIGGQGHYSGPERRSL